MKIPFNIKYRPQIESGEYKVETRDGKPVRIICWDRTPKAKQDKTLSIVALVTEKGGEGVYYYRTNGQRWEPCHEFDLFIITPDPELTEFEKKVASWLETAKDEPITNEMIVDAADNLLDLARKQIEAEVEKQKPTEWSEEDEKMLTGIIERGSSLVPFGVPALREEQMEWLKNRLKSLRPHPHWKPSEEQMKVFLKATLVNLMPEELYIYNSLCNDIQKLL